MNEEKKCKYCKYFEMYYAAGVYACRQPDREKLFDEGKVNNIRKPYSKACKYFTEERIIPGPWNL